MLWSLSLSTAVTLEWRPHPLGHDWPLSCFSKATRPWKLYQWNSSLPLRWPIWLQVPSTNWGFTPMSSTASAAKMSPLRPNQVRPHLAKWNRLPARWADLVCRNFSTTVSSYTVLSGFVFSWHSCPSKGYLKSKMTKVYFVFWHHQISSCLSLATCFMDGTCGNAYKTHIMFTCL